MRKVTLSKRVSKNLRKLLIYLEEEWSSKVQNELLRKLDKSLNIIQNYPESGIKTHYVKELRMHIITKQTSVFYKFDSNTIYVVSVLDNRMSDKRKRNKLYQLYINHLNRFPEDFMFQLNNADVETLVSQSVIPSKSYFGGALPYAFTEQGVSILSLCLLKVAKL